MSTASSGSARRLQQEALIRQVEAAFPFQPLPEMTVHAGGDDPSRTIADDEFTEVSDTGHGHTWPDLPEQHLIERDDELAFLDGEAFLYYLPAYLVFVVRHLDDVATSSVRRDTIRHALSAVTGRATGDLANYAQLNRVQTTAVAAVLRHVRANSPLHAGEAEAALAHYWSKHASDR